RILALNFYMWKRFTGQQYFPINLSGFHDVDTSRSTGVSGEKSSVSCAIECAETNVRRDKHKVLFKPLLR
ncbi:hypothetical protein, partial [Prevotella sp.]|uniref:hypothetical protein n=1 Tax=Prevotella sp. TaxID=59823 RepID=UPI00257E6890